MDDIERCARAIAGEIIVPAAEVAASKLHDQWIKEGKGVIEIEDAIRAAKERRSMERELTELRADVERLKAVIDGKSRMIEAQQSLHESLQKRADANCIDCDYHEICKGLADRCQRLEAALREIADDHTVNLTMSGQVNRHYQYKAIARAALEKEEK